MSALLAIAPAGTWGLQEWIIFAIIVAVAALAILAVRFLFSL